MIKYYTEHMLGWSESGKGVSEASPPIVNIIMGKRGERPSDKDIKKMLKKGNGNAKSVERIKKGIKMDKIIKGNGGGNGRN